eukprot:16445833-Heterocapsa_arctica.AAC.1
MRPLRQPRGPSSQQEGHVRQGREVPIVQGYPRRARDGHVLQPRAHYGHDPMEQGYADERGVEARLPGEEVHPDVHQAIDKGYERREEEGSGLWGSAYEQGGDRADDPDESEVQQLLDLHHGVRGEGGKRRKTQKLGYKFFRDWGNETYADYMRSAATKAFKTQILTEEEYDSIVRLNMGNLGKMLEAIMGYVWIN